MNSTLRKTLIFALVMGLVAAGGWLGRKAYKRSAERRLLAAAKTYLAEKDPRDAALCLQRALQINPLSLGAVRMMADLQEETGSPAAVQWRKRAAQLAPKDQQVRLAWAASAVKLKDFASAKNALDGLDATTKAGPEYHKLSGALAWGTGQPEEAERFYSQALKLEPRNPSITFNLGTIHLASTNPAVADTGRAELDRMTTNADFRLRALYYLKADALTHTNLPRALAYSWTIVRDPAVVLPDRMDHLQLLRATRSPDFEGWCSGLEAEARQSAVTAFAVGQWRLTVEGPTNALHWLQGLPPATQTNLPVPLLVADCYLFLQDWNGLLALVQQRDWGEGESFRLALEARAQRAKDEDHASQAAWTNAVHQAEHHLDRLVRLTQLSAKWGWGPEHIQLLRRIVFDFPEQRWAKDKLMAALYSSGNSRQLEEVLADSFAADPSNTSIKNDFAAICLLRRSGLATAFRLAREAYESAPDNPFFISTYSYALLLQNQTNAAEKVASALNPKYLQNPSIAAYYGVVEAQAGNKDAAREALQRAQNAPLLPEQKEMVRLASSGLAVTIR